MNTDRYILALIQSLAVFVSLSLSPWDEFKIRNGGFCHAYDSTKCKGESISILQISGVQILQHEELEDKYCMK